MYNKFIRENSTNQLSRLSYIKSMKHIPSLGLLALSAVVLSGCAGDPPGASIAQVTLPQVPENRVALVLGNGRYESPILDLHNSTRDAGAIADKLRQLDFDVIEEANLSLDEMQRALDDFDAKLQDADVGLFFYSGHGIDYRGRNYIIPSDAIVRNTDDIQTGLIDLNALLANMATLVDTSLILLDAGRNDTLPEASSGALGGTFANDIGQGLASVEIPAGTFIAYANAPGKAGTDGQAGSSNSTFSEALAQHIDDPCIGGSEMMTRVTNRVLRATNQQQMPWYSSSLRERFVFNNDLERCCPNCASQLVELSAGSFLMGATLSEEGTDGTERPQHEVYVDAFAIGKYEVTFAEWDECFDKGGCDHLPNDHGMGRGNRPVIDVGWDDAQQYVEWLNKEEAEDDYHYRLPTEAEWEYAARALPLPEGKEPPPYPWGYDINPGQANFAKNLDETTKVDLYRSNKWGLHDMTGNVWEWVEDRWHDSYEGAPIDGSAWLEGVNPRRVIRGGSWRTPAEELRSANRYLAERNFRSNQVGFRIAKSLNQKSANQQTTDRSL